ncbi:methyl-accepting chemotaxis protein [Marinospirillum alkaliphilum]|uniref:Methyl-accepting chemotaxis protein n=1 Tax=Marinospirillum alkaliphilum DSM 21637 TaxID=1122209 RepID=A0A1K1Z5P5_9GAMM|nr:methyl-accepting chemotaxis protein [Marinospirillum alkaliphilum]SFX69423.1 methyl-accepting chemotaxis protein [Marinospirillum alkaliphilum DSM 21637]
MTIAQRLYFGFGFILSLLIVITLVGVYKVGAVDARLTQINDVDTQKQRFAINFRGSVHDRAIAIRDAVLVPDEAARSVHLQEIRQLDAFYQEAARGMDQLFSSGKGVTQAERRLLADIQAAERDTQQLTRRALELLQQDRLQAQIFVLNQVSSAYSDWLMRINAFIDYQEQEIQQQVNEVRSETGGFQLLMVLVTGIALIVGVLVSVRLVSSLTRTIGGEPEVAARLIRQVADGDLTLEIRTRYPNSIMGAVADMTNALSGIIRGVGTTADGLAQAAEQMAETASLNQRLVQSQREQTEQGAAAINQMSATVQEVAGHTVEAARLAQTADGEAVSGSEEVKRTLNSINALADEVEAAGQVIDQLSEHSAEIGSVLEVIETIAEQTNLLALNAAIEAARAGEHGRGFAVVADEVRGLASRTQESTRDIQQRIEKMQTSARSAVQAMEKGRSKAVDSVVQARRAGDSLSAINQSVAAINDMNTQIASAAEEQSAVAEEINRNFSSITEASEQAAAGSNQISAASRELARLAGELQASVRKFRT